MREWHLQCRGCDGEGGHEEDDLEGCNSKLGSEISIVLLELIGEVELLSEICK